MREIVITPFRISSIEQTKAILNVVRSAADDLLTPKQLELLNNEMKSYDDMGWGHLNILPLLDFIEMLLDDVEKVSQLKAKLATVRDECQKALSSHISGTFTAVHQPKSTWPPGRGRP